MKKEENKKGGEEKGGIRQLYEGLLGFLDSLPYAFGSLAHGTGKAVKRASEGAMHGLEETGKGGGYLAHGTGHVVRGSGALVRRISSNLADLADHEEELVQIPRRAYESLLQLEPAAQEKILRHYLTSGKDTIEVPRERIQYALDSLVSVQKPKKHDLRKTLSSAAAIFLFFLSVFTLDQVSLTGYAVSSSSGVSFAGFYSLLGLAFLGISLFAFAHSERKRKKK